jgi:hypothetical protein
MTMKLVESNVPKAKEYAAIVMQRDLDLITKMLSDTACQLLEASLAMAFSAGCSEGLDRAIEKIEKVGR